MPDEQGKIEAERIYMAKSLTNECKTDVKCVDNNINCKKSSLYLFYKDRELHMLYVSNRIISIGLLSWHN